MLDDGEGKRKVRVSIFFYFFHIFEFDKSGKSQNGKPYI